MTLAEAVIPKVVPTVELRERGRPGARGDRRLAAALTLAGAILSLWMAWLSDGVYHDDDLTHFLIARWTWVHPEYLLHIWGRPGFTALYAVPAWFGWFAARAFSAVLTAATAWLCYKIAVRERVRLAALAPALLWLQPLTLKLSYTTLTETALAFQLALAVWLYARGRFSVSAAVMSLAMLTRHEAVVFAALWGIAYILRRRPFREWVWLGWAPLLHNALCLIFLQEFPLQLFFDRTPTSQYGSGAWSSMFWRWGEAAGPAMLVAAWVGGAFLWKRGRGRLLIGAGLLYFVAHTLIFRFGYFASAGYARFLVPIGPVVAIAAAEAFSQFKRHATKEFGRRLASTVMARYRLLLLGAGAASGLIWLAAELQDDSTRRWLTLLARTQAAVVLLLMTWGLAEARLARADRSLIVATLVPLTLGGLIAIQAAAQCRPLSMGPYQQTLREPIDWLRGQGLAARRIVATNVWFCHFLGIVPRPHELVAVDQVPTMQPGDLLLWDRRYGPTPNHRAYLEDLQTRPDFVEIWHGPAAPQHGSGDGPFCYIFEKRAPPGGVSNPR